MLPQATAMKESFPAGGAFLRSTTIVSNVKNKMRLLRIAGTALVARERSSLLRLMTGRSRIAIAKTLLMAPQMTGKGKTLSAVYTIILSLVVFAAYQVHE